MLFLCLVIGMPAGAQIISGIPAGPVAPGDFYLSFCTSNDNFGASFAHDWDDLRTFGFDLEMFILGRFGLSISYDSLTDRGTRLAQARIDELTVIFEASLFRYEDEVHLIDVAMGVGPRLYGDLYGSGIQDLWHTLLRVARPTQIPYEGTSLLGAVAHLSVGWTLDSSLDLSDRWVPFLPPGVLSLGLEGSALAYSQGEAQGSAAVALHLREQSSRITAGLTYYSSTWSIVSSTASLVNREESGFWLMYDTAVGGLITRYRFHLTRGLSNGSIGISFGDFQEHAGEAPERSEDDASAISPEPVYEAMLASEFGLSLRFHLLSSQIRWQPRALYTSPDLGKHISFVFDYRSGVGQRLYRDSVVRVDQFSAGAELAVFPIRKGFQVCPYISAALGMRNETFYLQSNYRTYPYARILFPVLRGEAGVRFVFGPISERERNLRYSAGISINGFVQLPDEELVIWPFYKQSPAWDLYPSVQIAIVALSPVE